MKKTVLLLFLSALICVLVSSCGIPKPPDKEDISKDLPDELTTITIGNPFDSSHADVYKMNVNGVAIEKRQTNEKEDIVYCWVGLDNEYYRVTKYVKLKYYYYDEGGWLLDEYSEYQEAEYKVLNFPFETGEIIAELNSEYQNVELKSSDSYFRSFLFQIEDVHKHGVLQGDVLVNFEFDGTCWIETRDTTNLSFNWDIVGIWQDLRFNDDKSLVYGCRMMINDFDQKTSKVYGTCSFYYTASVVMGIGQYEIQRDLAEAEIEVSKDNISIEWDRELVNISFDSASCEFTGGLGEREKIQALDLVNNSNKIHSSNEKQSQELSDIIDRYFEIIKSGLEDESIMALFREYDSIEAALEEQSAVEVLLRYESTTKQLLKEEFPNWCDDGWDDLVLEFAATACQGLTNSYEIVTANQYSMDQADARRMWATALEEEFYNAPANPDAYAEVLVKLSFYAQDKTNVAEEFCDFLLIKDDRKWGVYGADIDELPRMLFPF